MDLEISGPPGSGKTSLAIAYSLSARLQTLQVSSTPDDVEAPSEHPEVLLVGKSLAIRSESFMLMIDTEGSIIPSRLYAAAQALALDPGGEQTSSTMLTPQWIRNSF